MDLKKARDVLIKNFTSHPECVDSEQSARALIMDSIPQRRAEKNILVNLYNEGIVDELKGNTNQNLIKHRYRVVLLNEYGFSEEISLWCIDTWILIVEALIDKSDDHKKDTSPQDDILVTELMAVKTEYEKLIEEIKNLKSVVVALTSERDELKYHECRELAAEYDRRIGAIELKVMNAKLRVLELKRTIEILQAYINRQERKSEKKAREQAREEYRQFEEELNRKAEEAQKANNYKKEEDQKEEEWQNEQDEKKENEQENDGSSHREYRSRSDEMKALYRRIVKALHPDMNPDLTEMMKKLFQDAVDSYNCGNLIKLREIAAIIDGDNLEKDKYSNSTEDVEKLKEIIEGLKHCIDELTCEIDEIKTSFPYTMREFLKDEKAISKRQKELTESLYEYNQQIEELEKRIDEMMGRKCNNGRKKK